MACSYKSNDVVEFVYEKRIYRTQSQSSIIELNPFLVNIAILWARSDMHSFAKRNRTMTVGFLRCIFITSTKQIIFLFSLQIVAFILCFPYICIRDLFVGLEKMAPASKIVSLADPNEYFIGLNDHVVIGRGWTFSSIQNDTGISRKQATIQLHSPSSSLVLKAVSMHNKSCIE